MAPPQGDFRQRRDAQQRRTAAYNTQSSAQLNTPENERPKSDYHVQAKQYNAYLWPCLVGAAYCQGAERQHA